MSPQVTGPNRIKGAESIVVRQKRLDLEFNIKMAKLLFGVMYVVAWVVVLAIIFGSGK